MNDEALLPIILHPSAFILCPLESPPLRRVLIFVVVIAVACGKRGDPRPPVPVIPRATSDLVVTQRANKLLLSWSYPSLTTAGRTLGAVRRVTVNRYIEELPATPTAQPGGMGVPEPSTPAAIAQFANAPPLTAAQFGKLSQRIDSIEGANLAGATVGAKLLFEDTPTFRGPSGRPLRITYAVVTEGVGARSDLSNLASIIPLDVAVAPTSLRATASAEGVKLAWTAPAKAATGNVAPVIAGYNIYRTVSGELLDQFAGPVNPTPTKGTDYTDAPPYGAYEYRVTAVAAPGPPRIESDPSMPATATFKDLIAPPPPASLTALVETRVVRLVWDSVDAPDLAGYNVYRYEAAGKVKFTYGLPINQTHFGDESILPGIEYWYAVSSVDKSGNESKETQSQRVMVPKTP